MVPEWGEYGDGRFERDSGRGKILTSSHADGCVGLVVLGLMKYRDGHVERRDGSGWSN